ncbi:MAG: LuxR C-terminal-related transcriptional regulator [bacterium]|nr:LuxR C-terminal-related transcriptional regulator [bacterium]
MDESTLRVLSTLARHPGASHHHLAQLIGVPPNEIEAALATLTERELIQKSHHHAGWRTVGPQALRKLWIRDLDTRLADIRVDAEQSLSELVRVLEALRHGSGDPDEFAILTIVGGDNVTAALMDITSETQHSVETMHRSLPSPEMVDAAKADEARYLSPEVAARVIYPSTARSSLHVQRYLDWVNETGRPTEARTLGAVPFQMLMFDQRTLVVQGEKVEGSPAVLVVRAPSLVALAAHTFDHLWKSSTPWDTRMTSAHMPRLELQVLELMMHDLKDSAIAAELGVSTRTVTRAVSHLMWRAGAHSRFGLGAEAVRRGWISL